MLTIKQLVRLCILSGILLFAMSSSIAQSSILISDGFNTFDTNTWAVYYIRYPGDPLGWQSTGGTATISNGHLQIRCNTNRCGTSLETANPVHITNLPVSFEFRIRFPADGYRAPGFRLVTSDIKRDLLVWGWGTTHNLYLYSDQQIAIYPPNDPRWGTEISNIGPVLLPHDTWMDARIAIYEDRVEAEFNGLQQVAYTDMTYLIGSDTLPIISTFDDYTSQAMDIDDYIISVNQSPVVEECDGLEATIIGTEGDDDLHGTTGVDVIVGLGGNDIIHGHQGDDTICGGDGDDEIYGGYGEDLIYGGNGNDTIISNQNDDTVYGEAGNDIIEGGFGDDTLYGGDGDDNLKGQQHLDTIDGGSGIDTIDGGIGTDTCINGEIVSDCE